MSWATRLCGGAAVVLVGCLTTALCLPAVQADGLEATQLVTGKKLTPQQAGTQNVGSLPMNMVLTPDGKYALVSDMGFREYLTCLETKTGKLAQPVTSVPPMPTNGRAASPPVSRALLAFGAPYTGTAGLYYGLAVKANPDKTYTVYAAQGANATLAVIQVAADGSLSQTGTIAMPPGDFPAGLSLDDHGLLYVAVNVDTSTPLTTPSSLVVYDTNQNLLGTPKAAPEVARVRFNTGQDALGTYQPVPDAPAQTASPLPFTPPSYPYAVYALPSGSKVYVSSQRDGGIYVITLTPSASPTTSFLKTGMHPDVAGGSHPIAFAFDRNSPRLYIANAQDDSVSVLDTRTDTILKTLPVRPSAAPGLPGVTPTDLALAADGQTLYVTLGDMNAVAVVDLRRGRVQGYIPVGWYPSAVVVGSHRNLLVANAKGTSATHPNPGHIKPTPTSPNRYENTFYDLSLIEGTVSNIPLPNSDVLTLDTAQTLTNNLGPDAKEDTLTQIGLVGIGKIKHVIYIVKENRTYDQVLGDVTSVHGQAVNGDPTLAIFGGKVSPNFHALSAQFVWLDNFYDASEVSPDGWNWATAAMASEYVTKNVPYNYSSRGREYDFEGQNNNYLVGGFPAKSPEGKTLSSLFPNGAAPITDVATEPGGYLWDAVEKAGLSYRNYGFFTSFGGKNGFPDNYPGEAGLLPANHYAGGPLAPAGRTDIDYRRFDTDYADSDAPTTHGNHAPYPLPAYGRYHAPNRFQEWNREFQAMLASAKADGGRYDQYVPNLMTVKLMSDHTAGYRTGKPTPVAHNADNDYGVAELVEAVSHSPIWDSTAIFVIEDDAQDGPDHVDCHRSTCYVISPYVKPGTIDHTFHNSASVVKSISLLLGIPMLNQYAAYAPSFGPDFSASIVNTPYTALPEDAGVVRQTASIAFLKAHPDYAKLAKLSDTMDFTQEDVAPEALLNAILWQSVKGVHSVMPPPRHGVIPVAAPSAKTHAPGTSTPAHDADGDGD